MACGMHMLDKQRLVSMAMYWSAVTGEHSFSFRVQTGSGGWSRGLIGEMEEASSRPRYGRPSC
jgi:hypothetical protein